MTALFTEHPHLEVEPTLRELHIASSTFYRWRHAAKEPCERLRRDAELTEQIREIHTESGGIYGSPRVHAALKREGLHVGRKRVERLMRETGPSPGSARAAAASLAGIRRPLWPRTQGLGKVRWCRFREVLSGARWLGRRGRHGIRDHGVLDAP